MADLCGGERVITSSIADQPPISVLMRAVTRALQLRFDPMLARELIGDLRRAQEAIDAFMIRTEATISPSCRRLLLRLNTALEARVVAVSIRTQRGAECERPVERRSSPGSEKVPLQ